MPRRNLQVMMVLCLLSFLAYRQAQSEHRRMLQTMAKVVDEIDRHYYEKVDSRELFEGALSGMVSRLDPYSAYIPPVKSSELHAELEQKFGGIGIQLTYDREQEAMIVTSPLLGTPAFEGGIQAGDIILAINGESVSGMSMDDVLTRMRGEAGEEVVLQVLHPDAEEPVELTLKREIIHVDSVLGDHRGRQGEWEYFIPGEEGIAYARIETFGRDTVSELKTILEKITRRKARGLVLDLRYNGGGLLDSGVGVCDLFLREGVIVSIRGRDPKNETIFEASGEGKFTELPLIVLVNHFTASASEIVAGCLQDHGRAVIVGDRSWGKGTVQDVISLEGGESSLKLTTAGFWRPSGKNIHRGTKATEKDTWGIMPESEGLVLLSDEQSERVLKARQERAIIRPVGESYQEPASPLGDDPQLSRGVEILRRNLGAGGGKMVQTPATGVF